MGPPPARLRTQLPFRVTVVLALGLLAIALPHTAASQRADVLPMALETMINTEREFAARALVVGWKQAFLEYFSDAALGFDEEGVGFAKDQIRKNPDPPKDLQLLWEPRYGDIAGTEELGYLTGPSRTVLPSRHNGQPRHSVYASVWKRQRDGTFRVVMDVGVPTPREAPFAPGFSRAPHSNRFDGDYDDRTPPLGAADGILNSTLRSSQARAYRGRLAPGARLHRPNVMPLTGEANILKWLATQPTFSTVDSRFTEASRSGDLGYTWGNYVVARRGGATAQRGFYVRVWVRERTGQWKVALDVLQPQPGQG